MSRDQEFREAIRERDRNTCQLCGERGTDVSHYHSRTYHSVRWDEDNADLLCRRCHWLLGTKARYLYDAWKLHQLGEEGVEKLLYRKNRPYRAMGDSATEDNVVFF